MVPPFVGVAVKVTLVPAQIVPVGLAAMDTDGVTFGVTVIVTALDVAVVGDAQVAFEVSTQVMISPLLSDAFVYVALFVPTLLPFSFHW